MKRTVYFTDWHLYTTSDTLSICHACLDEKKEIPMVTCKVIQLGNGNFISVISKCTNSYILRMPVMSCKFCDALTTSEIMAYEYLNYVE